MTTRRLYLVWPDSQTVTIHLENNPAADYYYNCIKHLQNVPLSFNSRSNSLVATDIDILTGELVKLCDALDLTIDKSKLTSQFYLNFLHDVYFQNAKEQTFNISWLEFHDKIHLIEECIGSRTRHTQIWIDFQEKAGAFVKSLDRSWLKYSVTSVDPGDCIMQEHELGKSLLIYKTDNEPFESNSINQISKPWHTLRPIIDIQLEKKNSYQNFVDFEQEEFLKWFSPYRESWCNYWNIPDWQPWEMFAKIPIGKIEDLTTLVNNFSKQYYPRYIKR
jgi:hypothetical protein